MITPKFPLIPGSLAPVDSFDLEDCEDLEAIAKKLIDGHHPGVLTTVDSMGRPHSRWMTTMSFDDFPHIYTLTSAKSRKLAHIADHPFVNWMFSNQDLTLILNLMGHAQIFTDSKAIKSVWKKAKDRSHAYFLSNFGEQSGCAVLETTVDQIECCIPKSNLRWSVDIAALTTTGRH